MLEIIKVGILCWDSVFPLKMSILSESLSSGIVKMKPSFRQMSGSFAIMRGLFHLMNHSLAIMRDSFYLMSDSFDNGKGLFAMMSGSLGEVQELQITKVWETFVIRQSQ